MGHGGPVGYSQRRYWNRKYFTRYLAPSIRVKDHNLVKSNFEDRSRDEQGLLGSSLMIPFGKNDWTSQFEITRIYIHRFCITVQCWSHLSSRTVPDKWLLREIKRSASATLLKGSCQKLLSGIFPLRGGYPPFLQRVFGLDDFLLRGEGVPPNSARKQVFLVRIFFSPFWSIIRPFWPIFNLI